MSFDQILDVTAEVFHFIITTERHFIISTDRPISRLRDHQVRCFLCAKLACGKPLACVRPVPSESTAEPTAELFSRWKPEGAYRSGEGRWVLAMWPNGWSELRKGGSWRTRARMVDGIKSNTAYSHTYTCLVSWRMETNEAQCSCYVVATCRIRC